MIWLISSSIYIVSFCFVYLWLKIAFSKNGIWENTDATKSEMFITILPLFNTIALSLWFNWPRKRAPRETLNSNRFFGIKKDSPITTIQDKRDDTINKVLDKPWWKKLKIKS